MRFADMAKEAGLPRKPFYLVSEIAKATGWPESTVYGSMANGDLRKRLPAWKKRGGWPTSRTSTNGWRGCEMRKQKERALRDDLEIVRDALVDEEIVTHMRQWKNWAAAFALIALMFAYLHLVGWMVDVWM